MILRSLIGEGGSDRVVWTTLAGRPAQQPPGRIAYRAPVRSAWTVRPIQLARAIDAMARRTGATAIWIVAHGPIVPAVAPLARRFDRPIHLSVHDDPAWSVAFRGRRELPLTPWLNAGFGAAVRAAASIDVISGGMRAELARRYGVDSILVHRVLDDPIPPNEVYDRDAAGLSIGMLGSVYEPRQMEVLARTVARASRLAGVPGRIVMIGQATRRLVERVAAIPAVDVSFLGHRPEDEGVEVLRRVFALHLAYPFSLRARVLRRTSFPAKLATYLRAARPLLVQAPYDSTLTPLVDVAPFTIPQFHEDVEAGARQLVASWRNEALHGSQHEAAEILRARYFGPRNRDALFNALDRLPR